MATALAEAIARLEVRYGARTVATATTAAEVASGRRFATGTPFDRLAGGIAPGSVTAFAGKGTCGKVSLALRAVSGAQRAGGMAMWVDGAASFDPVAARHAEVDLARVIVVRARSAGEVVLASGAALRGEGFRIVVVDLGPSFAQVASPDQLAPLLASARGSTSALVIVSEAPARRIALPTFVFERTGWERRHGRVAGWSYAVRRLDSERCESERDVGDPLSSGVGAPLHGRYDAGDERVVMARAV